MSKKQYSVNNLLTSILSGFGLAFGGAYAQQSGYLAESSAATPFVLPVLVGLGLAVVNFRHLSKLAIILLPLMFGLSVFVAFSGIYAASEFGVFQGDAYLSDLLFEQLPFLFASWLMYKTYAALAGKKSFLVLVLHLAMSLFLSTLIFRKTTLDLTLILAVFYGLTALLFSLLHRQKDKG